MVECRLGLGVALFTGLLSGTTAAQVPWPNPVSVVQVERQLPHGQRKPGQINLADCLADDALLMTLSLGPTQAQGLSLEGWAGVNCDLATARPPSSFATCWNVSRALPTSTTQTIEIRVRDLLSGRTRGNDATRGPLPAGSAACESASDATSAQVLNLYVMLLDPAGAIAGMTRYDTQYRLQGPPPPDRIYVGRGDGELPVAYEYSDPLSSEVAGFQYFCDPPPNDPAITANGPFTIEEADATNLTCTESSELIRGASAESVQHLRCGEVLTNDLRGTAKGLVDGVAYNVAVAAVDAFENVGPLSWPACGVPVTLPKNDTARACSFAGTARGRLSSVLALSLVFGAAVARRMRLRAVRATPRLATRADRRASRHPKGCVLTVQGTD